MSIIEKMTKIVNDGDIAAGEQIIHDDYQFLMHSSGNKLSKQDILKWLGMKDVKKEKVRVLFENDEVGFEHAFASYNEFFPVYVAILLGVFGFIMEERGFPVVTIVLGVILGPIIEYNTRVALQVANADWTTFISTWPRIVIIGIIVFLVFNEIKQGLKRQKLSKKNI